MEEIMFEFNVSLTSTGKASVSYNLKGNLSQLKNSELDEMRAILRQKMLMEYGKVNREMN